MQISFSIFILLVSVCILCVIASPIGSNKRDKRIVDPLPPGIIAQPWPPIYGLCGVMGSACKNSSDCCSPYTCGSPPGYSGNSARCCGTMGVTGCKMTANGVGTGCCERHYCETITYNNGKTTTMCMEYIY
jgi:hypothetical protein